MSAHKEAPVSTRLEQLKRRMSRVWRRRSDVTSVRPTDPVPPVVARPRSVLAWDPIVAGTKTWKQVGGFASRGRKQIQLAASRAEPGGVPVFVDPAMVTPATAERMRPLHRD